MADDIEIDGNIEALVQSIESGREAEVYALRLKMREPLVRDPDYHPLPRDPLTLEEVEALQQLENADPGPGDIR